MSRVCFVEVFRLEAGIVANKVSGAHLGGDEMQQKCMSRVCFVEELCVTAGIVANKVSGAHLGGDEMQQKYSGIVLDHKNIKRLTENKNENKKCVSDGCDFENTVSNDPDLDHVYLCIFGKIDKLILYGSGESSVDFHNNIFVSIPIQR